MVNYHRQSTKTLLWESLHNHDKQKRHRHIQTTSLGLYFLKKGSLSLKNMKYLNLPLKSTIIGLLLAL